MRVHAIVDEKGNLVASGAAPTSGAGGLSAELRAADGQTRHELELPAEFEGKSPRELHEALAGSDLKSYVV